MKKFIFSLLVFACCRGAVAELRAVAFPKTIDDVPFAERVENRLSGYEPYKDLQAYQPRNIVDEKKASSGGTINIGGNTGNPGGSGNVGNDSDDIVVGGNENSLYYIVQCRTTFPHVRKYMASYRNSPLSLDAILTQDEYLECSDEYHSGINKCFTPCDNGYTGGTGKINQELTDVIPPFCAGNGIESEKNTVLAFTDPADGRSKKTYTKAEVDAVLSKINGYYKECGTNGRRWYWYLFVFESQDGGRTVITYDYKTIGK